MTQRERILGGGVGLLVVGFLLYFVGGWFLGIFTWRTERIDKLTDQKNQLTRDVRMGSAAQPRTGLAGRAEGRGRGLRAGSPAHRRVGSI